MTRDLRIVSASMLMWGFGEGLFYIFQPIYIQQFGADPILIGTVLGINGFIMALSQIPAGILADKFGRRPLMRFSWVCGVAATWIMAVAPSLAFFVVGMFLYGLTSSVMAPLNTYVQEVRGAWSVGKAVSFVSAAYNFGGILGPVFGGIIAESTNLRTVYFLSAVVFTISTIIVFFAHEKYVKNEKIFLEGDHFLGKRQFVGLMWIIFVVMFAVMLPQPLTANFLQNERHLSINQIGQLGSLGALGSVVLMLVFGHLRADLALLIGQAGVLLFAVFTWWGGGMIWYGAAYLFLGGYRLCRAMTLALTRPILRDHEVGFAFGVVESLNSLAFMLAPVLAGWIYSLKPVLLYPISAGLILITMAVSSGKIRHLEAMHRMSSDSIIFDEELADDA